MIPILKLVWGVILTPRGRVGMALAAIATFLGVFASDQRQRAVAKIEKANSHDVKQATSAAAKSRAPTGGLLDPYTADDH